MESETKSDMFVAFRRTYATIGRGRGGTWAPLPHGRNLTMDAQYRNLSMFGSTCLPSKSNPQQTRSTTHEHCGIYALLDEGHSTSEIRFQKLPLLARKGKWTSTCKALPTVMLWHSLLQSQFGVGLRQVANPQWNESSKNAMLFTP